MKSLPWSVHIDNAALLMGAVGAQGMRIYDEPN